MKNRVFEAALEIQRFCEENIYRFCVFGGVALQRWGENRNPNDADLTVIAGFGDEERFADAFLERFQPRIDNSREFALRNRVLLITAANGLLKNSVRRAASHFGIWRGEVKERCEHRD
jgi:hypothetical protein